MNPTKYKNKAISKKQLALEAYQEMLRARLIDQKILILYKQNKCHFHISVAGHEAVQVAAGLVFRSGQDWFYPYYRDLALGTALGISTKSFLLNSMNKGDDPNSHGRQMPNHFANLEKKIVSQSSPTGSQFNQAVGCALGAQYQKLDEVIYVSSGEGACSQGDFHEALNWAARDKLPIVFLIQNNKYAISVPVSEQLAGSSVYKLAQGYTNLERYQVDGTDFFASYEVLKKAHQRARSGKGPSIIEAEVVRLESHSVSDNQKKYRSEKELKEDLKQCPIKKLKNYLIKNKFSTKKLLDQLESKLISEINLDCDWAEQQNDPDISHACDFTFYDPHPELALEEQETTGDELYLIDAINRALDEELSLNKDVVIFGQDVAHGKGGVFGATLGLTKKFGKNRCFNSQLAESSIVGVAVGLASRGLKPVAEIQFGDYIWPATMQIRNELAMLHYRTSGDFSCPAVIRVAIGGYIHGGPYHSQNIEATFAHFPGIYIIYPSNAADAKGLLKNAIRTKDPVLFLEHKGLYRQPHAKNITGDINHLVPIGKAKICTSGKDLTIVTWGALVQKSLIAAREFLELNIEIEVIDLRTIVPWDKEAVINSIKKTNRLLIAHEDVKYMGFGAEISAEIAEICFQYLDAPIKRIGMKYTPGVPHSPVLENVILPQQEDLNKAIKEILEY